MWHVRALQKEHEKFLRANERMLEEGAEIAKDHAIKRYDQKLGFVPYHTGRRSKVVRLKNGRIARIVDKGTRKHRITPSSAKVLRFRSKSGAIVFARRVNHPGSGPFRFGYKAASSGQRVMIRFIESEAANIARRFSTR